MPEEPLRLVAGLGNPGRTYAMSRHNAGFRVIDALAEAYGIVLGRRKFATRFGRGRIAGNAVVLAQPLAYMNRCGPPTRRLAEYFNIPRSALVVVHDDIDLPFGQLRIKARGGHGGHNGVKSLMQAFGSGDFIRLRVGVGRPPAEVDVSDHVLGRFSAEEHKQLADVILVARDAAVAILGEGSRQAMNRFNRKGRTDMT
jgi:PTH1 family peptidyl-tRNA hydrolase